MRTRLPSPLAPLVGALVLLLTGCGNQARNAGIIVGPDGGGLPDVTADTPEDGDLADAAEDIAAFDAPPSSADITADLLDTAVEVSDVPVPDANPDTAVDAEVAPDSDPPDAEPPVQPPVEARVVAARLIGDAEGTGTALALVLAGIDPDDRDALRLDIRLRDESGNLLGAHTATSDHIVAGERLAAGPSWFYQLGGLPRLELRDRLGAAIASRDGVATEDGAQFAAQNSDGLALAAIRIAPHRFARAMWREAGLGMLDRLVVPTLDFSLVAAGGPEALDALEAVHTWQLTAEERVPCGGVDECTPAFEPRALTGGIHPELLVHLVVPGISVSATVPTDIEVALSPAADSGARASVLVSPRPATVSDPPQAGPPTLTGLPLRGAGWLELLLIPRTPVAEPREAIPRTYALAWVARALPAVLAAGDAAQPRLSLASAPSAPWRFWPAVPLHAYQVSGSHVLRGASDLQGRSAVVSVRDVDQTFEISLSAGDEHATCTHDPDRPFGFCAVVWQRGEDWLLTVVAFSPQLSLFPSSFHVSLDIDHPAVEPLPDVLSLYATVAVVFGLDVAFAAGTAGGTFSGDASLLVGDDAMPRTLATGQMDAWVAVGEAGHELVAARRNSPFTTRGGHIFAEQPIAFAREGVRTAPPAVVLRWPEGRSILTRVVPARSGQPTPP